MRAAAAVAVLFVAGSAAADGLLGVISVVGWASREIAASGALGQTKPLPEKDPNVNEEIQFLDTGTFTMEDRKFVITGGGRVAFRGYVISAEKISGDLDTEQFDLEGDARLAGKGSVITGVSIHIDFKQEAYTFQSGDAALDSELFDERISDRVYIRGGNGFGLGGEVHVHGGRLTTCRNECPHFEIVSEETDVLFGDTATVRKMKLRAWGKTIVSLPSLRIPLDRDPERFLPEMGQSRDEGYFVRMKFATPLKGGQFLDNRVDVMTKLGVGLGSTYEYRGEDQSGQASIYGVFGPQTGGQLEANHTQTFGQTRASFNTMYQKDYFRTAPGTSLFSLRGQVSTPIAGGNSSLSFNRTSSKGGTFKSVQESVSLFDSRRLGTANSRLNLTWNSSVSSGFSSTTQSERVNVRYNLSQSFRSFDADLLYQRAIPVGPSTGFFNSSDRTPMLTLRTDSRKLFGPQASSLPQINTEVSIAELVNPTDENRITRIFFDTTARDTEKVTDAVDFAWNAQFKQGVYSDDTAQYTLNYGGQFSWQLTGIKPDMTIKSRKPRGLRANLSYRRLQSFGFTPLFIDRTGRSDALSFDIQSQVDPTLSLGLQTGYDLIQIERGLTPWQLLSIRADWTPHDDVKARAYLTYDTFNSVWSSFRFNSQFSLWDADFVASGRYDGRKEKFAGATFGFRGLKFGKLRATALADWSGYTEQLNAFHLEFAWDLHCLEAVLEIIDNKAGFRSGRQIGLFVRIKAIPGFGEFGLGQRGQSINSGFGGFGY